MSEATGTGRAGVKTPGAAREGDSSTYFLARWRRAQQDRLAALRGKQDAEMSAEAAETLRKYELERVKRLKDFGVRSLSLEIKESVSTVPAKSTVKTDAALGRRPSWHDRWKHLRRDSVSGRERGEDAITPAPRREWERQGMGSPSSLGTTLGGSTQRGSAGSDENWL